MSTPANLWSCMTRSWSLEPRSERIVEDILRLLCVLDKIIEAKGCIVKDEFLRTGRRERSSNGKRELKCKMRHSYRKATLKSELIHPDCQEAYDVLMNAGREEVANIF